jgi:hypothetical protein
VGSLAERFFAADGWRELGYASGSHYARERLGMAPSSLKEKRALARRVQTVPEVAQALNQGAIGFVAASMIARVATQLTAAAWVMRAQERTVKHLREDVEVAELLARLRAGKGPIEPPDEAAIASFFALRAKLVSGEFAGASLPTRACVGVGSEACVVRLAKTSWPEQIGGASHAGGAAWPSSARSAEASGGSAGAPKLAPVQWDAAVDNCTPQPRGHTAHAGCCASLQTDARQRRIPSELGRQETSGTAHNATHPVHAPAKRAGVANRPVTVNGQTSDIEAAVLRVLAEFEKPRHHTAGTAMGIGPGVGRVQREFWVTDDTYRFWHQFRRLFELQTGRTASFVRFLCRSFLQEWAPVLARQYQWKDTYDRDGYECASPVCTRRDCTCHHLIPALRRKWGRWILQ